MTVLLPHSYCFCVNILCTQNTCIVNSILVNLYQRGGIVMVDFGVTLKLLRHKAGLTQQQLADRLWVSKATVSYYEQSLRCPSPEVLVKIASVFHVSTDYLLGLEEKKQTLDITDLESEDVELIQQTVDLLRKKNLEKTKTAKIEYEK